MALNTSNASLRDKRCSHIPLPLAYVLRVSSARELPPSWGREPAAYLQEGPEKHRESGTVAQQKTRRNQEWFSILDSRVNFKNQNLENGSRKTSI